MPGSRSLVDPCRNVELLPVAWTDDAELGVSPEMAFSAMLGTCSAPFRWDASAYDARSVEPRTSAAEMAVTVEADRASARVARPPPGAPEFCHALLVDVTVTLHSSDGLIVETGQTTLSFFSPAARSTQLHFGVDLDEAGGSLEVGLSEHEQAKLDFTVEGVGAACTGRVSLWISSQVPGSNMASGGGAVPGSWGKDGAS
jgi:hypothetical protein